MVSSRIAIGSIVVLLASAVALPCAASPSEARGEAYAELIAARLAARHGTPDDVRAHLRRASSLEPGSALLHAEAAGLFQLLGMDDDAGSMARRALALQPDEPKAMRVLADLAATRAVAAAGDIAARDEAIRLYERLAVAPDVADEIYGLLANLKMHAGDADGAVDAARKFAERRPGDEDATTLLSRSLVRDGHLGEALDTLLTHLEAYPEAEDLLLDVYEIARRLEAWERIGGFAERLLVSRPDSCLAHALHGQALLRLGHVAQGAEELETALALEPAEPGKAVRGFLMVTRSHLLTAYDDQGRLAEAVEVAQTLAREYPANASVQLALGDVLARQGDGDGAIDAYATALHAMGPQVADGPRHRDELRRRMAALHLASGRPERAQRLLVTMEAPDDPHALDARIRHALLTGRLEQAEEMVERLRRTGGGRGLAALAEGELLLSRGKTRRAIPRLEEAMDLLGDPVRPRVAELLRTHRQSALGEGVLRSWVEREPSSVEARYRLGVYLDRTGSPARGEVELWKAIELDTRHAPALNYLGYALAERGDARLDEALALVQRALEVDRWNGAYRDSLGWILYRLGRFEEAREPLEAAARCYPFDPTVLEHLGDLYAATGDETKALESWTRALEARPSDGEALRTKIQKRRDGRSARSTPR